MKKRRTTKKVFQTIRKKWAINPTTRVHSKNGYDRNEVKKKDRQSDE